MIDKKLKLLADNLFQFMKEKHKFDKDPTIEFKFDDSNANRILGKTGYYDPDNEHIVIFCTNRHPKDILRSLSHEIIHHIQKTEGRMKPEDTADASDENYILHSSFLKKLEEEAFRDGNLEAWVQSKITKAADYIDTAADYIASGEMEESVTVRKGILPLKNTQIKRSTGAGALSPEAAKALGDKAVELRKKKLAQTELPKINNNKEETTSLVDKIISEEEEILNNKISKVSESLKEATRLQAETSPSIKFFCSSVLNAIKALATYPTLPT